MMLYKSLDGVMPLYRDLFAGHDLTEQQWRVLRVVWRHNNVTSAELSEQTLLAAPSLVGIVDRLENKGFVSRIRSADDRRQIFVVATSRGQQLQQQIFPQLAKIEALLKSRVTTEEWAMLEHILCKVSTGRNDILPEADAPILSSKSKTN